MRKLLLIFTLTVLFVLCSCRETADTQTFFALDTAVSVSVSGDSAEETAAALRDEIISVGESAALCFKTTAEGALPAVSELVSKTEALNSHYGYDVNIFCGELTALWGISTASPRIPTEAEIKDALRTLPKDSAGIIPGKTRIDPGAVAKGYALDRAKAVLDNTAKTDYAVISTESSVLLYGEKPNGEPFTTGIKDPAGGLIGYVKTEAAFISTAGGAERFFTADGRDYIHILDLSTGYPCDSDLASVTVIIPADEPDGGIKSDFLSTAMFITGSENLDSYGVIYVAIGADGEVYTNTEVLPV